MNKFFEQCYFTTVADMDLKYRLTPFAILNYCQDIATRHARILGVSREELLKRNCFWVVNKISFKILKNIGLNEDIKVSTWIPAVKHAYTDRDYIIYNSNGEKAVLCTSRWCVVDSKQREIKPMRDIYSQQIVVNDKLIEQEKINIIEDFICDKSMPRVVGVSEIDVNLHLNNARYASRIFDMLDVGEVQQNEIDKFSISYLKEVLPNEKMTVNRYNNHNELFFIGQKEGGEEAFRAKITLK